MFKRYFIILLVALFLLSAFPTIASSQDVSLMPTWEYEYIVPIGFKGDVARPTIDTGVIINGKGLKADGTYLWDFLDQVGAQGWELIDINADGSYIFKRQKR